MGGGCEDEDKEVADEGEDGHRPEAKSLNASSEGGESKGKNGFSVLTEDNFASKATGSGGSGGGFLPGDVDDDAVDEDIELEIFRFPPMVTFPSSGGS